ncbi:hypothetical protein OF83DRAFT_1087037 [Amylostereum chailletii]|nr:hypothetical protein OF83DRAFT_1087037 [Amylostereum chailletii]
MANDINTLKDLSKPKDQDEGVKSKPKDQDKGVKSKPKNQDKKAGTCDERAMYEPLIYRAILTLVKELLPYYAQDKDTSKLLHPLVRAYAGRLPSRLPRIEEILVSEGREKKNLRLLEEFAPFSLPLAHRFVNMYREVEEASSQASMAPESRPVFSIPYQELQTLLLPFYSLIPDDVKPPSGREISANIGLPSSAGHVSVDIPSDLPLPSGVDGK